MTEAEYRQRAASQALSNQDPSLPADPVWQGPLQATPRAYSGKDFEGEVIGLSNRQTYRAPRPRRGSDLDEPDQTWKDSNYDIQSRLRAYLGLPPDYRMDLSLIDDTQDALGRIPWKDRTRMEQDLTMDLFGLKDAMRQGGLDPWMSSPDEETASRRMEYDVALDLPGIQHRPGAIMGTPGVGEQLEEQAFLEEEFARAADERYTPSAVLPWKRHYTGPAARDQRRENAFGSPDAQGPTLGMISDRPTDFPTESAARKRLEHAGFRPERESMERRARQLEALLQSVGHPYGQAPVDQRERQAQEAARAVVADEDRRELIRQVPQLPGVDLPGLVDWLKEIGR